MTSIKLGDEYDDFEALVRALRNWAIKDHFVYFVKRHDRSAFVAICCTKHDNLERFTCPWNIRAIQAFGRPYVFVNVMNDKHNCIAFNSVGARQPAFDMAYLLEKIPSLLIVTTKTTSLAIKDAIQLHLGQLVPKD
jgi:hypothetical protein